MKILGAVLRESGVGYPYKVSRPLSVEELELDDPGGGEVLIQLQAAGVCHSDLSVVNGSRQRPLPMLLGHEGSGKVVGLGSNVPALAVGDHVVTVFLPRCDSCANCATEGALPCLEGSKANANGTLMLGSKRLHTRDGRAIYHHLGVSAFATHAVVHHSSVVKVGPDVPPPVAATLGCAVLTGGGAVVNAGKLIPGQDLIVVGLGGVGMAALLTAIAITRKAGGKVIGVDANPIKNAVALSLGADMALTPGEAIDKKLSAPVVIEAAGHPRAFETALQITAPGGCTVTAGLPAPDARASISPLVLTAEARTIVGSYLGSSVPSRDIPRFERMWRSGDLPVEKLVTSEIGLDLINHAFDELREGHEIRQMIRY